MAADYVPPNRRLYLTPNAPPVGRFCRQLQIPDDPAWVGLVDGALSQLAEAASWREFGTLTPEETAEAMLAMLLEAWENPGCGTGEIPTPFWDDVTDTDDEFPPETQPWYGYVTDPDAEPGELTFVEDATIWVLTGMLAVGASPAAAILFQTIAPRFALAMRGGDVAEIIRIVLDGEDVATIETSGDPDELFEIPVVGDPEISIHDLFIILREVV